MKEEDRCCHRDDSIEAFGLVDFYSTKVMFVNLGIIYLDSKGRVDRAHVPTLDGSKKISWESGLHPTLKLTKSTSRIGKKERRKEANQYFLEGFGGSIFIQDDLFTRCQNGWKDPLLVFNLLEEVGNTIVERDWQSLTLQCSPSVHAGCSMSLPFKDLLP